MDLLKSAVLCGSYGKKIGFDMSNERWSNFCGDGLFLMQCNAIILCHTLPSLLMRFIIGRDHHRRYFSMLWFFTISGWVS